jgi:hypothetical protein
MYKFNAGFVELGSFWRFSILRFDGQRYACKSHTEIYTKPLSLRNKFNERTEVYTKYPLSSVLIYNGTTILHYLLGGVGIILGYNIPWIAK